MSTATTAYGRILEAASELFYRQGFHAVGVEAIAYLRDPSILAGHLLLLMDGAFAARRLYGPGKPAMYVALLKALLKLINPIRQSNRATPFVM